MQNQKGQILLIYRRGKWDLPKGHLERGESMQECAKREVMEETGISDLKVRKYIGITRHTYTEKGKDIIKESHWYLMHTDKNEELVPQTEEGIEKVLWVDKDKVQEYYTDTWPSVVEVLKSFI